MSRHEPVDLTNCDREPIQIPGSIQPHGVLIACDGDLDLVLRVSANAPSFLGLMPEPVGCRLDELFTAEQVHAFRNALATAANVSRAGLLMGLAIGGRSFDVAVHRAGREVVIEFEEAPASGQPLQIARELIGRTGDLIDVDRLLSHTSRLLAGVLDYDRVLIYRFEEDGSGKVVSEAKRGHLESFLGQYFPAADIPRQARELYLRNIIRIIVDVDSAPVPIVPVLDGEGTPLDLSHAHLRSVSPIHCEYLRNMGVGASMSISIIVDGTLWGLIACHHYSPKALSMAQRVAMEMFGGFFSLQLKALTEKRVLVAAAEARAVLDRLLRQAPGHRDAKTLLRDSLEDFAHLLPNDGIGLWIDGEWMSRGSTPPGEAIHDLVSFVSRTGDGRNWSTFALSEQIPSFAAHSDAAAGVLAVPLSLVEPTFLFFFRKELAHTLEWAGNPDKRYETGPHGERLTPRKSFAIWKETVRGKCQPWTDADRGMADVTRVALVEVVLRHHEQMSEERSRADVRQRMLNEELTHRVKNILAVIKSLVAGPAADRGSVESYVSALQGRIQALSIAHDQVVRGGGGGRLADLLGAELGPYRSNAVLALEGPPVWLDARAYSVMALVLHEMATNAAKYGALSVTGGRLAVSWDLDAVAGCRIRWREEGGPPVRAPERSGFGSALVRRSIPFDLGGQSKVEYAKAGVEAHFVLPTTHVAPAGDDDEATVEGTAGDDAVARLARRKPSILIVEDQLLIAMDLEADLVEWGAEIFATAASVAQAMEELKRGVPDFAILDINLGPETSLAVAQDLRRRGVPFVLATGYGDAGQLPEAFVDVPVVRKPYDRAQVVQALARVAEDA